MYIVGKETRIVGERVPIGYELLIETTFFNGAVAICHG